MTLTLVVLGVGVVCFILGATGLAAFSLSQPDPMDDDYLSNPYEDRP